MTCRLQSHSFSNIHRDKRWGYKWQAYLSRKKKYSYAVQGLSGMFFWELSYSQNEKKLGRNVKPTEANDDGLPVVVNIKKLLLQDRNSKISHLKYSEKNINLKKKLNS